MNADGWTEQGVVFDCGDNRLVGVIAAPSESAHTGVLLLVGGPQYRVGSHRQFTLLARSLAGAGIPSLRFDYSGMGDSEGELRDFSDVQEDLGAAIAQLRSATGVQSVVLWGLCDAASSAMMYAHQYPEVCGLVLLNPWVHGEEHSAAVKFSHYYRPLLTGRENWSRLISGDIDVVPATRDFLTSSAKTVAGFFGVSGASSSRHSFVQQMLTGFGKFQHESLIVLSEDDLTAHEYSQLVGAEKVWKKAMARPAVRTHTVQGADHTFSSAAWMQEVAEVTIDWVKER